MGQYVKHLKSGEVVELEKYGDLTAAVLMKDGAEGTVGRSEIRRLTPDEELEFLKSKREPN